MDRRGGPGTGRGDGNRGSSRRPTGRGGGGRGFWRGRFGRPWFRQRGSNGRGRGSSNSGGDNNDVSSFNQEEDQQVDDVQVPRRNTHPNPQFNRGSGRWNRGSHQSSRGGNSNTTTTGGNSSDSDSQTSTASDPVAISKIIRTQWIKKFPGYQLYFPHKNSMFSDLGEKLKLTMTHIRVIVELTIEKLKELFEKEMHDFGYEDLVTQGSFMKEWKDFESDLENFPQDVLNIVGLAFHQVVYETINPSKDTKEPAKRRRVTIDSSDEDEEGDESPKRPVIQVPFIRVGILKTNPVLPFKNLKASYLGKLVIIRGAVMRTGNMKIKCIRLLYKCVDCTGEFLVDLPEGKWTKPKGCGASEECGNKKSFQPVFGSRKNKYVEHTTIRVQDVQHSYLEHGRIPRTIDCLIERDLIKHSNAGDVLTICGIVQTNEKEQAYSSGDQALHSMLIKAVAIKNHKESERTMGGHWFSFSNKDYYAVKEIFEMPNSFRLLVASLTPSIFGHEMVKAGILLAMFGGTDMSTTEFKNRSDINVIVVGDPGLGKSQILKVVSEVAPRGVYVCGTGTTTAGLTVTLVKEGDDFSLEAGALVMGDRGVCCIDEFDKMQSQHSALLETMEQQSVSVAKAGVLRTLPARTSVIAAANPVGGHYDNTKTVSENIKIGGPLLSRFDLIYVLQDKTDQNNDQGIINHIMGLASSTVPEATDEHHEPGSLQAHLKIHQGEVLDLIPHHLLRKYIAYAKQFVHPKLDPAAAEVIKEFYLKLRKHHRSVDSTPVTTRQLESIKRLAEARAKAGLRENATEKDARQAIQIFEFCMSGVYENDTELVSGLTQEVFNSSLASASVTPAQSRSISRNVAKKLLAKIESTSNRTGQDIFTTEEITELAEAVGIETNVNRLIDLLNNDGYLLKKGPRQYKFQC